MSTKSSEWITFVSLSETSDGDCPSDLRHVANQAEEELEKVKSKVLVVWDLSEVSTD